LHTLKFTQLIPKDINKVWDFFSSPHNLETITPDFVDFKVTSAHVEDKIYPGMIITYKIKPVFNIPVEWVTEITHIESPNYFVDEQRYGPYSFWHHKHFFKETEGGVQMTDLIHYRLPFWFAGRIINSLFVERRLRQIFEYRRAKVDELFK
jgi:ligand-binding SRPBCC domain-containing protein